MAAPNGNKVRQKENHAYANVWREERGRVSARGRGRGREKKRGNEGKRKKDERELGRERK